MKVYSQLRPKIVKPPTPLSIFSRGISYNVGNNVKIWLGDKPLFTDGRVSTRENPFMNAFFSIDFITIIALILSLLALLFTYDSCSGEREQGTLKLMLSISVNRWKVLLGKISGILMTLLPIILFSFMLSILIILFHLAVKFSVNEWLSTVLLLILCIVFLCFFISLGLLISSRIRSSSVSIIVCLFLWVSFVYIIPNLATFSASSFVKAESRESLDDKLDILNTEFRKKCEDYRASLTIPRGGVSTWGFQTGNRDGYQRIGGASGETHEFRRTYHQFTEPLRIEYADKKWIHQKAYLDKLDRQRKFAEYLSFLSLSEIFRLTASTLCKTDAHSQKSFINQCRLYREAFIQFLNNKDIFASFKYFTNDPPEEFMTIDEIIEYVTEGHFKTLEELVEGLQAPGASMAKFYKTSPKQWDREYYPDIDLSDMPRFSYETQSISSAILISIIKIAILIIGCVLMFYLAFVSFIKYDVR